VSESPAQPAPRRRRGKFLLLFSAGTFLAALILLVYINTESFQSLVRRRVVAELERITGGRVEIGSIHTTPFRGQVDVRNLTIHGSEAASDVPLAHADRIVARLKLSSLLLRSEFGFYDVNLVQPVIHVAFYPDGTTNIPARSSRAVAGQSPVEKLFALSIDQFQLRQGRILWDDQTIPVNLDARDSSLAMNYSFLHGRYDGNLNVGWVDTKLANCRPFAWMSQVQFSLQPNYAAIPSLQWNAGHSHLSAQGQITNFRRPQLQGSYEGQIDLGELGSVARRPDLRGGSLQVKGRGEWSLDKFASEGLLTARDLAWQSDQIGFTRASVEAGYEATDQELKLSKIQGRIFGGSFSGETDIQHWLAPAQHLSAATKKEMEIPTVSAAKSHSTAKPKALLAQSAVVSLRLHDLSVDDVAAALNAPAHKFPAFHPVGAASGSLEARWKGDPRDAEVQFGFDVTAPAHYGPSQLPVSAHSAGVYNLADDSLNLSQFLVNTPTSRVQASGTLSKNSALRLSLTTSSLADWLPLIAAVRGPALFPVTLNGSVTLLGNMSGSVSAPQIAGTINVNDFQVNLPATSRTQPIQTRWDSLSASVQVSFDSFALHNATLRRDDTVAEFDVSTSLQHGHFLADSPLDLRANIHNADLTEIQAFAGYDFPVSGKTDLFIQANGTVSSLRGDGQIHITDGGAFREAIQQFDAQFHIAPGEISLSDMHLFHDDSVVTGSATYRLANGSFVADLSGRNFDLARFPQINTPSFLVEGRADFHIVGSGTPKDPQLAGNVRVRNLTFDHELAGDLDLQATTQGSQLRLTGQSAFQRGSVAISGTVDLRNAYLANLDFQMNQLDLDALWRSYLHGRLTDHSAVAGTVNLRGPINRPAQWIFTGNLESVSLELERVKLHNQDPVRFTIADETIQIHQLHLEGEGSNLSGHGSIQLSGDYDLDLAADGTLDLKLLSGFDPEFTSTGVVTLSMTIGGTFHEPLPQGRFQVHNGSLSYAGLPSGLTELNGSLLFTREHFQIDSLTARTGGGTIDLKGDATLVRKQLNFNVTATGKDVRLRYPPGVSSTADSELHWAGTLADSTLSGDIRINKMAVTPGFDFSAYLERSRNLSTITPANSALYNVKLDIHVQTAPELQMRTAIGRLSGDADLRVRGSAANPAILGRVDILEGKATFHGTRFTLERGDITFTNPVAIEPQLNLQASTHVRSYDLNVTLTGIPSRGLNLNYRSEPPLPKSDIIALLALGHASAESEQLQEQSGQSTFSDQATEAILNEALNSTVSSRLQRLFGASNIKIDPQGLSTETNPTARGPQVSIEQEFANNLSLTYSTNVSQSSQQIIQGEYYVNRNLSVVGTRDQNGVVSFDVRLRRRKK